MQYELTINLRRLDEVAYKEEFSEFINPDTYDFVTQTKNLTPYLPTLSNVYVMVEYIFLTSEERNVFSTRLLEYLTDQIKYSDALTLNDANLLPVYQIGSNKKIWVKEHGIKKERQRYDKHRAVYLDKNELDALLIAPNLIPRNNYKPKRYIDRTGITKLIMVHDYSNELDPFIHQKRIEFQNYFHDPTKYLVLLIRPIVHIDPLLRIDECHYFHGERQWDNYSLYSYYDLSAIVEAKCLHYESMRCRINDVDDPIFGFETIINQTIRYYELGPIPEPTTLIDTWIAANSAHFMKSLLLIRDLYISFENNIVYGLNTTKLKENLINLNIDYPIVNINVAYQIMNDIYFALQIDSPLVAIIDAAIIRAGYAHDNFLLTKSGLILIMNNLLSTEIINENIISESIEFYYQKYNYAAISLYVDDMGQVVNINNFTFDFATVVKQFNDLYLTYPDANPLILQMIQLINDELIGNDFILQPVQHLTYKDIINQLLDCTSGTITDYYKTALPYDVIRIIVRILERTKNHIIDCYPVQLINYQENMYPNQKINPLISGYLKYNSYAIMPKNSLGIMWSDAQSYQYFNHTPSVGINLHSWALKPLMYQPSGSSNLSKIEKFESVYNVRPEIGDKYPAQVTTIVLSLNIMRYISGLGGKAW
jgi:hypothetical protein